MNFSISSGSIFWLILSVLGAVLLAAWAYRFALPALSKKTRGILWGLRSLAFILLLLLLARPLLSLAERSDENQVVLLEDISLSMDLPSGEADRNRSELAREAIEQLEKIFEGRFTVRRWVFASEAQLETYDSLATIDRAVALALQHMRSRDVVFVGHGHFSRAVLTRWIEQPVYEGIRFSMYAGTVGICGFEHGVRQVGGLGITGSPRPPASP